MSYTAFISHASKDAEIAKTVCRMLEERGVKCWIAPRDITPGKDYGEEIIRGIECTTAMILVLSEHANESTFVKKEVERAVSKSKAVFPLRIREVAPSVGLELFISSAHWIDAWQAPMDSKIDELANSLRALSGLPPQSVPAKTTPVKKPLDMKAIGIGIGALIAVAAVIAIGLFLNKTPATPAQPATQNAIPATQSVAVTATQTQDSTSVPEPATTTPKPSAAPSAATPVQSEPNRSGEICPDPSNPCQQAVAFGAFRPHELPFVLPAEMKLGTAYQSVPFFMIILESSAALIPENKRIEAQKLFPAHKVFISQRLPNEDRPVTIKYANTNQNFNFMAVYAGTTKQEADQLLKQIQSDFKGANVRATRIDLFYGEAK
ncbi:MAG: putative transrane sensor protein [Proteobacteria bacterium]|nr:putative transrane sensor protein [Pseudomonadota bacterium]